MASEQFVGSIAPFGSPTGERVDGHPIRVNFIASEDIAAGDWVALDTSKTGVARVGYVTLAGTLPLGEDPQVVTGDPLTVGVAALSVLAGALCPTVIEGYVDAAKTDDTSVNAAGLALVGGKTVAGQAGAYEATDLSIISAFSLGASVAGYAPVWVCRRF